MEKKAEIINLDEITKDTPLMFYEEVRRDNDGEVLAYVLKVIRQ